MLALNRHSLLFVTVGGAAKMASLATQADFELTGPLRSSCHGAKDLGIKEFANGAKRKRRRLWP